MPQGVEIYRPDGSIQVTLSDRLMRIVGSRTLSGTSGSVTVDDTKGTPWGVIIRVDAMGPYRPPSISGGTISWTADDLGILLYGVY